MPIRTPLYAALLTLAAAGPAGAQACLGIPGGGGAVGAEVGMANSDRVTAYSATAHLRPGGPLFASATYTTTDTEGAPRNGHGVEGTVGVQAPGTGALSLCATAGAGRGWYRARGGATRVESTARTLSVGLGAGLSLASGALPITLYATPRLFFGDYRLELNDGGEPLETTRDDRYLTTTFGAAFGPPRLHGGPYVSVSSLQGAEPAFGLRVGVRF